MSETPTETEPDRETRREFDAGRMRWLSGLVALIGLVVLASPFLFETTQVVAWNNVVLGLAIFLIAGYNFYRMSRGRTASTGSASLVALLGLWALISPFVIPIENQALAWTHVVVGIVVAGLSGYNAYASSRADRAPAGARA